MEDKRAKIAAARKKLKQYQSKRKQDPSRHDSEVPDENVPLDKQQDASPVPPPPPNAMQPSPVAAMQEHRDDILNQNSVMAPTGSTPFSISNYFSNGAQNADLFTAEPLIAPAIASAPSAEQRPAEPSMDASLYSINKISEEIGNLIANASADLGPQNTILELESEKADLARQLNAEKLENDELRLRLRNNQSTVDELRIEIDKLRLENSTKVTVELGPIQEQLQMQIQAVGVLVGEKAELTASLSKCQSLVKERSGENDELQNRLKASRATVQKLEKELETIKTASHRYEKLEHTVRDQVKDYQLAAEQSEKLYKDLQEDVGELRQKLTVRNQEYQASQKELDQAKHELSLAKLRIAQLASDDDQDYNAKIESLTQQNLIKAQQIKDLQEVIKQIGSERDQSNQQYQNYVLHLNKEISNLAEKIQELTEENNRLSGSEENLVRHVSELEKQIQQQMVKQQTYAAQQQPEAEKNSVEKDADSDDGQRIALEAEIQQLQGKCATLEKEREEYAQQNQAMQQTKQSYEQRLKESEERMSSLQLTVEKLLTEQPDTAKLLSEIESGKVGASRAVAQNQELKVQLEEMQRAFVQISNDKLSLTDKLQTELHLGKEMRSNYGNLESELNSTKEKLHYKDEEMIRLAHANTELNRQLYQNNQEIDRLRYYESRANDLHTLQSELESSQLLIKELQAKLQQPHPQAETSPAETSKENGEATDDHLHHEIETLRQEKEELLQVINNFQSHIKVSDSPKTMVNEPINDRLSTASLPTHTAMEKLQERFKRTMLEVADLTEEKQRLEHLVMQLQGETETIGEYITLYQQQRRLLKQKDMERDLQLQQLADDRSMMKLKLKELNYLVHRLVLEKGGDTATKSPPVSPTSNIVDLPSPGSTSPSTAPSENGDATEPSQEDALPPALCKVHIKPTETAGRILSLLTDIKEANIPYGSGVQHCSCCSGRLETV